MSGGLARPGAGVVTFTSTVTGPLERGVEFGETFRDEVRATVGLYRALLARCPNPDVDLAEHGSLALAAIERFSVDAADEIRGIATGAGCEASEVAGINARTELLAIADPEGVVECSTVVSAPAFAPVAGAQTWDWFTELADNWLLWTIPLPDGREVAAVTEFGILGKIGVNDAGLGLLFSILHHASDGVGVGVPVHVLARTLLERARSVTEARELVMDARVTLSASSTFTLLDRGGSLAVELFPEGWGTVTPDAGWLVRTNHFLSAEGRPGDRDGAAGPNSAARLRDLEGYVRADPERTHASLVSALTGHDREGALCAHPSESERGSTLATVVIDTAEPSISAWRGWPCSTPLVA